MTDMTLKLTREEADDLAALLKDRPELADLAARLVALAPPAPASGFRLGTTSRARLTGVHPDLVQVVEAAIQRTPVDFTVLEGVRTQARQAQLVAKGASKTMNSYHLTGHAVDLAPLVNGQVSWDWADYYPLAKVIKATARELGVPIVWGGDWTTFRDGPHWQIVR